MKLPNDLKPGDKLYYSKTQFATVTDAHGSWAEGGRMIRRAALRILGLAPCDCETETQTIFSRADGKVWICHGCQITRIQHGDGSWSEIPCQDRSDARKAAIGCWIVAACLAVACVACAIAGITSGAIWTGFSAVAFGACARLTISMGKPL